MSDSLTILITGAAGKTGRAVIAALESRGAWIRAMAHRAEQAELLVGLGVSDVIVGDLDDPVAVQRAVGGIQLIYHICPNFHPGEITIGEQLVVAARKAHVRRIVLHSVLHPQAESMPHHGRKLRVEQQIIESGLAFTILQPGPYMQNLLPHWEQAVRAGVYEVPYSLRSRFSWVDLVDVAEAAGRVLMEAGHENAIYELAGPETLDSPEVAAVWESVVGTSLRAKSTGVSRWAAQARISGLANDKVQALTYMFRYYQRYGLVGNPNTLAWLLARPGHTMLKFLQREAKIRSTG